MGTQRMSFVELWARYVREHPDKDWSSRQRAVIDPQFPSRMSQEEFLRMKQQ